MPPPPMRRSESRRGVSRSASMHFGIFPDLRAQIFYEGSSIARMRLADEETNVLEYSSVQALLQGVVECLKGPPISGTSSTSIGHAADLLKQLRATKSRMELCWPKPMMCTGDSPLDASYNMDEHSSTGEPEAFSPDVEHMTVLSPETDLVSLLKGWRRMKPQRMAQRMKQAFFALSVRFDDTKRDKELRFRDLGLMWKLVMLDSASIADNDAMPAKFLGSFVKFIERSFRNQDNFTEFGSANLVMGTLWALCNNQSACDVLFGKMDPGVAQNFAGTILHTIHTFNSLKTARPLPQGLWLLHALLCLGSSYHTMHERVPRVGYTVVGTIQHVDHLITLVTVAKTPEVAMMCSASLCNLFSSQASVHKLCESARASSQLPNQTPGPLHALLSFLRHPNHGFKAHKTTNPDLGVVLSSILLAFNVSKHGGLELLGTQCLSDVCGLMDWTISRIRIVAQRDNRSKASEHMSSEEQEKFDLEVLGLKLSARARELFSCSAVEALHRILLLAIGTAACCLHHTARVAQQCVAAQELPPEGVMDRFVAVIQWCRDEASKSGTHMRPDTPETIDEEEEDSLDDKPSTPATTTSTPPQQDENGSDQETNAEPSKSKRSTATPFDGSYSTVDDTANRFDRGDDPADDNEKLTPAWVLVAAEAASLLALTRLFRFTLARHNTFVRCLQKPTPEFIPPFAKCLFDLDACLSSENRFLNIDLLTALLIVDPQSEPVVGPSTDSLDHFYGPLRQPLVPPGNNRDTRDPTRAPTPNAPPTWSPHEPHSESHVAPTAQRVLARLVSPHELIPEVADLLAVTPLNNIVAQAIIRYLGLLVLVLYHKPPVLPEHAIVALVIMVNDCPPKHSEVKLRLSQVLWCLARDPRQRRRLVKCGATKCLMTNAAQTLAHIRKINEPKSNRQTMAAVVKSLQSLSAKPSKAKKASGFVRKAFQKRVNRALQRERMKVVSGQVLETVNVSITTLWLLVYDSGNWDVMQRENLPMFSYALLDELIVAVLDSDVQVVKEEGSRVLAAQGMPDAPTRPMLAAIARVGDMDERTAAQQHESVKKWHNDLRAIANYEKRMCIAIHCLKVLRLLANIPSLMTEMRQPHVFQSLFTLAKTNTLAALGKGTVRVGSVLDIFVQLSVRVRRLSASVLFAVPWPQERIRDQGYVAVAKTFWTDPLHPQQPASNPRRNVRGRGSVRNGASVAAYDVIQVEEVRQSTYGCHLLATVTFSETGYELVRTSGVIDKLLALALTRQHDDLDAVKSVADGSSAGPVLQLALTRRREQALHALVNLCLDARSQELLCARGLYKLFRITWTTRNEQTKRLCGILLKQICSNARNRTRIFKAELRSRNVALDSPTLPLPPNRQPEGSTNSSADKSGSGDVFNTESKEDVSPLAASLSPVAQVKSGPATTTPPSSQQQDLRSIKPERRPLSRTSVLTSVESVANPDAELRARFCDWVDVELAKARTRVEVLQGRRKARKRKKEVRAARKIAKEQRRALQRGPDGQGGLVMWSYQPLARRASAVLKPVQTPFAGVQHLIPKPRNSHNLRATEGAATQTVIEGEAQNGLDERRGGKGRGMRLHRDLCVPLKGLWEDTEGQLATRRLPWDPLAVISQPYAHKINVQVMSMYDRKPTFAFDSNVSDTAFIKPGKARLNMWRHSHGSRVFEDCKTKMHPFNVGRADTSGATMLEEGAAQNSGGKQRATFYTQTKRQTAMGGDEDGVRELSHSEALKYVQDARKELLAYDAANPSKSKGLGHARICRRATATIAADNTAALIKAREKIVPLGDIEASRDGGGGGSGGSAHALARSGHALARAGEAVGAGDGGQVNAGSGASEFTSDESEGSDEDEMYHSASHRDLDDSFPTQPGASNKAGDQSFKSKFSNRSTFKPKQQQQQQLQQRRKLSKSFNPRISHSSSCLVATDDDNESGPAAGQLGSRVCTEGDRMVYLYYSGNSSGMIEVPTPGFLGDNSVPDVPCSVGCLGGGLIQLPSSVCSPSSEGSNSDCAEARLLPQVWRGEDAIGYVATQVQRKTGQLHWLEMTEMPAPLAPPECPDEYVQGEQCEIWSREGELRDWCVPLVFKISEDTTMKTQNNISSNNSRDNVFNKLAASVQVGLRGSKMEAWTLDQSVFAPRRKLCDSRTYWDEVGAYKRALRSDWTDLLQKQEFEHWCQEHFDEENDPSELLEYLEAGAYRMLCNTYRWYSSMGLPDDIYMAPNEFSLLIQDAHLADPLSEKCKKSNIDVVVVSVISSRLRIEVEEQKHRTLTPNAFVRFRKDKILLRCEYLEVLLRVAALKYIPDEATDMRGAFQLLMERCFIPVFKHEHAIDPDNFRNDRLYFASVDKVLKGGLSITKRLFKRWSGDMKWEKFGGKRGRMTVREWNNMWKSMGMYGPNFTKREAQLGFKMSVMHVNSEVINWGRAVTLDFPSFLEALARVSEFISIPTDAQLTALGVADIFEFYDVMIACPHLWDAVFEQQDHSEEDDQTQLKLWVQQGPTSVAGIAADEYRKRKQTAPPTQPADTETPSDNIVDSTPFKYDSRPLSVKVEQLLILLSGFEYSKASRQNEQRMWAGGAKKTKADGDGTELAKTKVQEELANEANHIPEGDTFELAVATMLHEAWTSSRPRQPDGTVEPCIKYVHGKQVDIANVSFAELPSSFKLDNLLSAHAACESIRWAWHQYIMHLAEAKLRRSMLAGDATAGRSRTSKRRSRVVPPEPEGAKTIDREAFYRFLQATEFIEPAAEIQHAQYVKRNLPAVNAAKQKRAAEEQNEKEKSDKDKDKTPGAAPRPSSKVKASSLKPKTPEADAVAAEREAKEKEAMLVQQLVETPYRDLPEERRMKHRLIVEAAVDTYIKRDKRLAQSRERQLSSLKERSRQPEQ